MYYTVLYYTVLYCTGPYIAIQSHDVSMSIITAIIKMRKFADKQASKEQTIRQTDGSKTETTLSSVDTRGSWPINTLQYSIFQCTSASDRKD